MAKLKQSIDRNTLTYWIYSATPAAFTTPIHVLYLTGVGIDLQSILFLKSFGYLSIALMELPVGLLSDRIKRKWILSASSFAYLFSQLLYLGASPSRMWTLYVAECLFILSTSLYSGTKSSIIADHLTTSNRMKDFGFVQSTALTLMRIATLAFVGVGGLLFTLNKKLPYLANIAILLLGGLLILRFNELFTPEGKPGIQDRLRSMLTPVTSQMRKLWPLILLSGFIGAASTLLGVLIQPYLSQIHGLSTGSLTVFYQVYSFAALAGGFLIIPALKNRMNLATISIVFWGIGAGFILLSHNLPLIPTLGLFIAMHLINGLQNIFFQNEIHQFASRSSRATLLSIVSIMHSFFRSVFLFLAGNMLNAGTGKIREVVFVTGTIYLAVLLPAPLLLHLFYVRVNAKTPGPPVAI